MVRTGAPAGRRREDPGVAADRGPTGGRPLERPTRPDAERIGTLPPFGVARKRTRHASLRSTENGFWATSHNHGLSLPSSSPASPSPW
jgi:hypothetical protein